MMYLTGIVPKRGEVFLGFRARFPAARSEEKTAGMVQVSTINGTPLELEADASD